jgi:PS-10 peptidase S37
MLKNSMIRSVFIAALLVNLLNVFGQTDEVAVENALHSLSGVNIISKEVNYKPYRLEYQLSVRQPIDHGDTSRGYFYQQVHLVHKGFDKAMVMETEGYNGRNDGNELERILHCNDLNIEFRYFNKSKPDSLQWQYLSFEQATADLHHINQLFRTLYTSKWISTGISRGGETALTYKYFFPHDVDAVVPYVAPIPNDIEDVRIYAFLDTAGGTSCVNKIKNLQVFLLKHEDEALKKIPFEEQALHYASVGGIGQAFEYAVLEYPFSFWQITDLTEKDIPTGNNLDTALHHMINVFGDYVATFSDERNAFFIPHAYMTYQTGYYK